MYTIFTFTLVPSDRYFVSTPAFRDGVPATLSQIIDKQGTLKPFPRWPRYNKTGQRSCEDLFSVVRFHVSFSTVDENQRFAD